MGASHLLRARSSGPAGHHADSDGAARPERAYVMAAWCTATSVAGGLLGYSIGALLYDPVGAWLIGLYGWRRLSLVRPMRIGAHGSSF